MFHVQLPSWLKARQLAMGMARNKRRYIAQVYKIPQNRLRTLHSLGVFSAVSFAKTLRAAIVSPFAQVKRSRRPQTKYRYCESVRTTSMATNASVCARALEFHFGEPAALGLFGIQVIANWRLYRFQMSRAGNSRISSKSSNIGADSAKKRTIPSRLSEAFRNPLTVALRNCIPTEG